MLVAQGREGVGEGRGEREGGRYDKGASRRPRSLLQLPRISWGWSIMKGDKWLQGTQEKRETDGKRGD